MKITKRTQGFQPGQTDSIEADYAPRAALSVNPPKPPIGGSNAARPKLAVQRLGMGKSVLCDVIIAKVIKGLSDGMKAALMALPEDGSEMLYDGKGQNRVHLYSLMYRVIVPGVAAVLVHIGSLPVPGTCGRLTGRLTPFGLLVRRKMTQ